MLIPDGTFKKGLGEPELQKLNVGDKIQIQRVGFAKVDQKKPEFILYFTHR